MFLNIPRALNTIGWSVKELFDFLKIDKSRRDDLLKKGQINLEKENLPYDSVVLVFQLTELIETAVDCFGTKEIARGWFNRKNYVLGEAKPKKWISRRGLEGLGEVRQLIGHIKHSIYS